jgi:argininosuccinate lyase
MTKLWDKGYKLDKQIESFTVGNDYEIDQELVYYDCIASKVHADMLQKADLLTAEEAGNLKQELDNIIELHSKGNFPISRAQEDCHTAIEEHLSEKLGDVGKKIHTARSRNDQVLTALRLYYKAKLSDIEDLRNELILSIGKFSDKYGGIEYPGYTHMQKAMPSSFGLWASAFVDSMEDNGRILATVGILIDQSPLGTAAGYGVPLDIDREFSARELGFSKVQDNPIYTQHSRGKFEVFLIQVLSQFTADINKIASDLILFNMEEFAFINLPDQFCTGSSIMPQKKNPDVLELLRAKHHVVTAAQYEISGIIGNLISGYNRDLQLTKEPVIKAINIVSESLAITAHLFDQLTINKEACSQAMSEDLYATEKAYELVKSGIPFRDAYKQTAEAIRAKK